MSRSEARQTRAFGDSSARGPRAPGVAAALAPAKRARGPLFEFKGEAIVVYRSIAKPDDPE